MRESNPRLTLGKRQCYHYTNGAWQFSWDPANRYRSYGVMVSTLDFESSDPGSNPGRTFFLSGDKTRSDKKKVVKFFVRVLACE